MLKNVWTKIRSAARLNNVQRQHRGNKKRCNISDGDGWMRNAEERLDEGQVRRSPQQRTKSTPREQEALQHRADGDGWMRNAEECLDDGQDSCSSYYRLKATLRKREEMHHRADEKGAEVEGARAALVHYRNGRWAPSFICAGLGGCPRRKAHTLSPG
ncbi:MAG: hypothetical protein ABJP93_01715 [Marinobacter sp.]|uniref:hypothetical protein n=1 Tax=Marinobacter sp. TaxID=50741 RepID=UPI003299B240